MSQPASERLGAVLRAAQYLSNLTPQQDPWAELAHTLESFFRCDLALIVRPDGEDRPRLVQAFTRGIPAEEILRLTQDEVRAVLETGFLGTQTLASPACSLVFLPLPRDRRTAAVAIVGQAVPEPFTKEDLEILLALGGLFANVVARIENERELRDHQQTLEGLVARRTADLEQTNARLVRESAERRASEAALKQADQRKNEFIAVLSHELRTPLAAVSNSMFILEHAAPGSGQALRSQALIGRQVAQLSRLVDDLLDVTRITHNKIQLQRQRMDLVQAARNTIEDQLDGFEANGVRLIFKAPEQPVWILADPARVAQMLGNLLTNAGKFTGRDGQVTLEVQVRDAHLGMVRVTDTGIGMAAEMLGRLFQPFEQAERSLAGNPGGLGLGLALTKGLAQLHGGGITASSPGLGQGSRFVLTLPMVAHPDQPQVAPPVPSGRSRRHRILVIEDNLDAALTLKLLLEHFGHEVATAHSGRTGLERAKALRPEVVFCDIGLPDTDGYSVARALRTDPQFEPAYLVAMTGYGQDEDKRRAQEAGFDRHLTKPTDPAELERLFSF
jgi:signal transduction histidine kinase